MKIYVLYLITMVFLLSCGSSTKRSDVTNDSPDVGLQEAPQFFDPHSLEEDDVVIEKKETVKVVEAPIAIETKPEPEVEVETKANEIVSGFRIQLSASKDSKKMRDALNSAKSFFNPRGYEVYLVYESPMYKLRVGDTINRKKADKLLTLCKESGFRDAWVVPDMVNSALDQGDE